MLPPNDGMHHRFPGWNVEINHVRNINGLAQVDPSAFIGNVANEARQ
jgi:hypothetical protein